VQTQCSGGTETIPLVPGLSFRGRSSCGSAPGCGHFPEACIPRKGKDIFELRLGNGRAPADHGMTREAAAVMPVAPLQPGASRGLTNSSRSSTEKPAFKAASKADSEPPAKRIQRRERSGPQARGSERSHGSLARAEQATRQNPVTRRGNRSLRPAFSRTPACRSRLRTNGAPSGALSEPRAERAAGPRERAVTRVTGPGRTGDAAKHRQPARQPLTPAGVLTNAGLPFAAPNQWRAVRGAFRAASGAAEGRGSERLHRPAARDRQSVAPTAAPPAWCRSNRSRFITLVHALMKSRTNFSPASAAA